MPEPEQLNLLVSDLRAMRGELVRELAAGQRSVTQDVIRRLADIQGALDAIRLFIKEEGPAAEPRIVGFWEDDSQK